SRSSSGWSSVWTALRFSPGSSGMPFGTAHDTATPSRSSRRSQCSRVALCSWTTKRAPAALPLSPAGSEVSPKSRFPRYSASFASGLCGVVCLPGVVRFSVLLLVGLGLALLGEAVERARVLGVLGLLLHQLLGLLEALRFAAAGFVDGLERRVIPAVFSALHSVPVPALHRMRTERSEEHTSEL